MPPMKIRRDSHTATVMPNGQVVVAGGTGITLNPCRRWRSSTPPAGNGWLRPPWQTAAALTLRRSCLTAACSSSLARGPVTLQVRSCSTSPGVVCSLPQTWAVKKGLPDFVLSRARCYACPDLPQDMTLYWLRHSCITNLVKKGYTAIAKMAGTSVAMIEKHYFHFTDDDMREMQGDKPSKKACAASALSGLTRGAGMTCPFFALLACCARPRPLWHFSRQRLRMSPLVRCCSRGGDARASPRVIGHSY